MDEIEAVCLQVRKSNDLIHDEIVKMGQDVKTLRSKTKTTFDLQKDKMILPDFPFKDIEALSKFEEKLVQEEGSKVSFERYLKRLGGFSYKNALHIIMKTIISPELGMQFSMRGRSDKKKFESLEIFKCIKGMPVL